MNFLFNYRKYSKKTVLVTQAHPDDADYYCGALVHRLAAQGANVIYAICTRGEKGTLNRSLNPDELTRIRREEQKRANEILGVADTVFFDYPDGELSPTIELQGKLMRLIRFYRPDLLLTFDPSMPDYAHHPDHHAVALATLRANAFALLPHYFPEHLAEGLNPHQCPNMLLFDSPRRKADTFIPVGLLFRKKYDAFFSHASQTTHMLDAKQKKLVENLNKIPADTVVQAIAGLFAPEFVVEPYRTLTVRDLLK
ncbi:MAG: PIG-L deacetylase family protein [bacterium]